MCELNKLRPITWCGYGDDACMHTFYGDRASIKALGEMIFELEALREEAKLSSLSRLGSATRPSSSPMGKRVRRMLKARAIGAATGLFVLIATALWVLIHG